MKGSELRLIEYMEGSKKRFIIPVYQRNYDWKIENCKQLYDDLVKVIKQNRKSHFFGSLVSVYNPRKKYGIPGYRWTAALDNCIIAVFSNV